MPRAYLRAAWPYGLYGVLALAFCWPIFEHPNGLGVTDWDQHLFYYGAVLKNGFEYGQLPFWNPWYCGGNVLWQNPQVALLSPVYPLSAVMSLPLAMKINIVLHYWLGFAGMHLLLTRVMGVRFLPLVVYLASFFTLAGSLVLHLNAGHSVFLPAFYLPWMLYAFLRSVDTGKVRDALAGGAVLAACIFNGGLHIAPMAAVVVGGIGVAGSIVQRRVRPFVLAVTLVIAGLGFAAPKLVPTALFVRGPQFTDVRTGFEMLDRMDVPMLLRSYLDPYQTRSLRADFEYQRHQWTEYGNYVGALAILLTAASISMIALRFRSRHNWLGLALAATTVMLVLLTAGEFARFAPAMLAKRLPLFDNFRVPSRYGIAFTLVAPLTIAWTARAMAIDKLLTGTMRQFVAVVFVLGSLQLVHDNRVQFNGVFPYPPLDHGFRWGQGPRQLEIDLSPNPYAPNSPMLRSLMAGKTYYNCYEPLQLVHTADTIDPLITAQGRVVISDVRFSPNRITFGVVNGPEPSRVILNQNFADGWSSDAGAVLPSPPEGKPSVMLAPNQVGRVSFRFLPPGLTIGLGLGAVTLFAAVAVARRERKDLTAVANQVANEYVSL